MAEHEPDPVRGRPPGGVKDATVPPPAGLPPEAPGWRPDDQTDLHDRFDDRLAETPRDRLWFPHLLVRGAPGDTGQRPLWEPTPCWLSPDIHLVPAGEPFDLSRTVQSPRVGDAYMVAVHVWNLGRFPAYGVAVRVWWVEPGFFAGTEDPRYQQHFIGGTMVDLGDRDSGAAHRIVEIPTPWTVEDPNNGGHECLLAAVESFADPWDGALVANADRHVAQRNVTLFQGDQDIARLMERLDAVLYPGVELGVHQAGIRAASLEGAVECGLASTSDTRVGLGPVSFGRPAPVTRLTRSEEGWTDTSGRLHGTLTTAVMDACEASSSTAAGILASLTGTRSAALHLTTTGTGYTIILWS